MVCRLPRASLGRCAFRCGDGRGTDYWVGWRLGWGRLLALGFLAVAVLTKAPGLLDRAGRLWWLVEG